jgi:hypothetical protein
MTTDSQQLAATLLNLRSRTRVPSVGTNRELSTIAGMLYWLTKSAALKPFAYSLSDKLTQAQLIALLSKAGLTLPKSTTKVAAVKMLKAQPVSAIRPLILADVLPTMTLDWKTVEIFFGISKSMRGQLCEVAPFVVDRWVPCEYGKYPVFKAEALLTAGWHIKAVKDAFLTAVDARSSQAAIDKRNAAIYQAECAAADVAALALIKDSNLTKAQQIAVTAFIASCGKAKLQAVRNWVAFQATVMTAAEETTEADRKAMLLNLTLADRTPVKDAIALFNDVALLRFKLQQLDAPEIAGDITTVTGLRAYARCLRSHIDKAIRRARKSASQANVVLVHPLQAASARPDDVIDLRWMSAVKVLASYLDAGGSLIDTGSKTHWEISKHMPENCRLWCAAAISSILLTSGNQKRFPRARFDLEHLEDAVFGNALLLHVQGVTAEEMTAA